MKCRRTLLLWLFLVLSAVGVLGQTTPGALQFPSGLDTPDSLFRVADIPRTTLSGNINSSVTTITVASTSQFPVTGSLKIDNEKIYYTGKNATQFTGLIRGAGGSSAAPHLAGARVNSPILSEHHNTLASAIVAIEAQVGYGASTAASAATGDCRKKNANGTVTWQGCGGTGGSGTTNTFAKFTAGSTLGDAPMVHVPASQSVRIQPTLRASINVGENNVVCLGDCFSVGNNSRMFIDDGGRQVYTTSGTQLHLFGSLALASDASPPQITADVNDYTPTALTLSSYVLRLTTNASRNLTGLSNGADGRIAIVHNVGTNNLVIIDESVASLSSNRFALSGNLTLTPDTSALFQYDSTSNRWRLIGSVSTDGGGVSDGDKGDITVSGSTTVWTVDAGLDTAKLADGTVSNTEFQFLNGVSSAIQTQLDTKAALASPTFTGTVTIPTPFTLGAVSVLPTGTELNFVDGVTSAIQTQLDSKQAGPLTGDVTTSGAAATIADNSVDGTDIALGSDAPGDVMYYNGTDWVRLPAGTTGYFLKTQGVGLNPLWAAVPGGGDALTSNPLSQFAATTSSQLASVLSDELGTAGGLVRGTGATLTDAIAATSFQIPNGAAPITDAFGEIAGDNNAWATSRGAPQWFDGTANVYLIGALVSDVPTNGQVPKWNTGGTITWEDGAGDMTLAATQTVTGAKTFNSATLIATRPRAITSIDDNSGNELLQLTPVTSAINQIVIENAIAGSAPKIGATGDDAVVNLGLTCKGAGCSVIIGEVSATTSYLDLLNSAAPSMPAAGTTTVYIDSTTKKLTTKDDAGTVTNYGAAGGGITSLEGQTGATQTFTDDTNVTIVSAANAHAITWAGTLAVARGGTGAATLTGLLQGNGTSAVTAITNSVTVGQTLRVTATNTYAWGALDLADTDAVTGILPDGNIPSGITRDSEVNVQGTANEITSSGTGAAPTLSLPASIDLGGKTSFEIPNGAAPTVDAFGEIAGDNNLWATGRGAPVFFDGTAAVALIGALVSDIPTNGQVLKWNTGGTITWEADNSAGTITGTDTHVMFFDGANTPAGDAGMTYNKTTNSLTIAGNLTVTGSVTTGDGTVAGESILSELTANGSEYFSWLGQDSRTTTLRVRIPAADPTAGQLMAFSAPSAGISTATWVNPGSGTPGGANTQVQFNSTGTFAADADLTFATDTLTATKLSTTEATLTGSGGLVITFAEHASAPATPAAANVALYAKTDGLLYSKDDAGTETLVSAGEPVVQIVVLDTTVAASIGDGKFYFVVPSKLNGMNLVGVSAQVNTVGTTNTLNVDLARCAVVATGNMCSGTVVDMLSVNLTIDSTQNKSSTAAAAAVINTANDDVATDQIIRVDIDAIHTTASLGLILNLSFRKP